MTTYRVRDCNVDKTLQDYRTELVHNLNHCFIIILQWTEYKITVCTFSYQNSTIFCKVLVSLNLPQTVQWS